MITQACVQHQWQQVEQGFQCEVCPAVARECTECGGAWMAEARQVCDSCVAYWQRMLTEVATWANEFQQDPYTPVSSMRIDPNRVTTSEDDVRLPFGLDRVVSDLDSGRIADLKTVNDAMGVLAHWASRWGRRHHNATITDAVGFLREYTMWALENQDASAWGVFVRELREVRGVVRRLLGIAPVREAVPCVQCGGQVVRSWGVDGLSELRQCSRCGSKWPEYGALLHTNMLVLQGLPVTHPELQVTLDEANRIMRGRVAGNQIHMWVKRGKLLAVDRNVRGDETYVLGDVEALVVMAEQRRREAQKVGS